MGRTVYWTHSQKQTHMHELDTSICRYGNRAKNGTKLDMTDKQTGLWWTIQLIDYWLIDENKLRNKLLINSETTATTKCEWDKLLGWPLTYYGDPWPCLWRTWTAWSISIQYGRICIRRIRIFDSLMRKKVCRSMSPHSMTTYNMLASASNILEKKKKY